LDQQVTGNNVGSIFVESSAVFTSLFTPFASLPTSLFTSTSFFPLYPQNRFLFLGLLVRFFTLQAFAIITRFVLLTVELDKNELKCKFALIVFCLTYPDVNGRHAPFRTQAPTHISGRNRVFSGQKDVAKALLVEKLLLGGF